MQQIGIPNVTQPFTGLRGRIERVWFEFLQLIWNRTGGASGVAVLPSYTVATLPAGLSDGAQALATDANSTTFHATAVGGSTNVVPVIVLGGVWRIG